MLSLGSIDEVSGSSLDGVLGSSEVISVCSPRFITVWFEFIFYIIKFI